MNIELINLDKGGTVVRTSYGLIQYGIPPETIKDTMDLKEGVPDTYLIGRDLFDSYSGVCICELEFPAYFNFFAKQRKTHVICTAEQKERIISIFESAVFGPSNLNQIEEDSLDDIRKEMAYFRGSPFGSKNKLKTSDFLQFHLFKDGKVKLGEVEITRLSSDFIFKDKDTTLSLPFSERLPVAPVLDAKPEIPFTPPNFGVSIIGSGHGFDKKSKTCGFVIWANQKGILVDPPIDSTHFLREMDINTHQIHSIILTHTHADHDSGTLQKIVEEHKINLHTSLAVFESFVIKGCAMTGLSREAFAKLFHFLPVNIGNPTYIEGIEFRFRYSLHSVPTVGFEVFYSGKSFIYTSDHLYDPKIHHDLFERGFISKKRYDELLSFPWHHPLIFHEAGVPPLHTPLANLEALPDDIKKRIYLLHVSESQIKKDSLLRVAKPGLDATISLKREATLKDKTIQYLEIVSRVPLFRDFPIGKGAEFLSLAEPVFFEAGDPVIQKGEGQKAFFVIVKGQACIQVSDGDVPYEKIYSEADYFGETSIVLNIPRTASVYAKTDLECLCLEEYEFLYFIRDSGIKETLTNLYQNRINASWELMELNPLFRFLSPTQKTALQAAWSKKLYPAGHHLFRAGDSSPGCFLIISGKVTLTRADGREDTFERGDFLYDSDGLNLKPCSSTAKIKSEAEAYFFEAQDFHRFIEENPGFSLRFNQVSRALDEYL